MFSSLYCNNDGHYLYLYNPWRHVPLFPSQNKTKSVHHVCLSWWRRCLIMFLYYIFTFQSVAIYDRFGRLIIGDEELPRDVLEYVVLEKHLPNRNGAWRIHAKIVPPWAVRHEVVRKTMVLPMEEEEEGVEETGVKEEEVVAKTWWWRCSEMMSGFVTVGFCLCWHCSNGNLAMLTRLLMIVAVSQHRHVAVWVSWARLLLQYNYTACCDCNWLRLW